EVDRNGPRSRGHRSSSRSDAGGNPARAVSRGLLPDHGPALRTGDVLVDRGAGRRRVDVGIHEAPELRRPTLLDSALQASLGSVPDTLPPSSLPRKGPTPRDIVVDPETSPRRAGYTATSPDMARRLGMYGDFSGCGASSRDARRLLGMWPSSRDVGHCLGI